MASAASFKDRFGGMAVEELSFEDRFGGTATLEEQAGPPGTAPPIPQPVGRPEGRPRSVAEATGGRLTRGTTEAAGALAGSLAAAPAGPGAMLVGGTAGVAGGSIAFDNLTNLFDFLKVIDAPTGIGPLQASQTAISEAATDAAFLGGFALAAKGVRAVKPAMGVITGVRTDAARFLTRKAEELGLRVGATDVATGPRGFGVRLVSRVAGMFPFVGGAARAQSLAKGEAVIAKTNDILNRMAPNVTLANQLGIDATRAAQNTVSGFNRVSGLLYNNYRVLLTKLENPSVVPTDNIRDVVGDVFRQAEDQTIILKSFKEADGTVVPEQALTQEASEKMLKFVDDLRRLPDTLTFEQMFGNTPKSLINQLREIVSVTSAAGGNVRILGKIKGSMEEAANSLRFSVGEDAALLNNILDARETANLFFSKGLLQFQKGAVSPAGRLTGVKGDFDPLFRGMETFKGKTGQAFTRVDPNIFRAGPELQGSLDADEILRVAVNLKDAKAVDDLAALIGRDNIGKVGRLHVERAFDDAKIFDKTALVDEFGGETQVVKGVDWNKFLDNVGLSRNLNVKTSANEGTERLIKLSGVDPQEIRDFVNIVSRIQVPQDVAQFIARRAMLGGATSALAGASTALVVKGSPSVTIMAAVLARFGLGGIANPEQLKQLQRAFAPGAGETFRKATAGRFFNSTLQHLQDLAVDRRRLEAEQPTTQNPFAPPPVVAQDPVLGAP